MYIGADYYPEHWPERRWKTDARMMQQAGFNVTRLAEFAWARMEPREGVFDFQWLDDALDVLAERGVAAILCTPTAAMPAWAPRKYPEVMAMKPDGQRVVWGVRRNNCFTSGAFRMLSERITRAMADRYAGHPNVIGWQTDNELGHPGCCCDTCRAEWQDWLRAKYGTLDALNDAWGTRFWGHTVSTWGEIPIPDKPQRSNPGACLDHRRYFTWLNVRFQREQVRVLRERCGEQFITHNLMGLYPEIDYYDFSEDLDFVSWDNYPVHGAGVDVVRPAIAADLMRGVKGRNFWIMEQTAGPPGSAQFGRNPEPGMIRKVAYQQLAHGCDGQVWFRWRTCTVGREQYWHGLLGHDGKGLRRYKEAARTAGEYHKLADKLEGTTVRAKVAMIHDYDCLWALNIQPGFKGNNYHQTLMRYYEAIFRAGVNVDMVSPSADFSKYSVVFAPGLFIMPDELGERLTAFVEDGGVLVTDLRSGVKDEFNRCHERTLPGLLSKPLGIRIPEYGALAPDERLAVSGTGRLAGSYTAELCADWVEAKSADTLAGYDDGHMKKYAAATRNAFGKGTGYYVGTVFAEPAFYDALIADVLDAGGVRAIVSPPEGVEASVREGAGRGAAKLLILVNHTDRQQAVDVPSGKTELLTEQQTGDSLTLAAYDAAVIEL